MPTWITYKDITTGELITKMFATRNEAEKFWQGLDKTKVTWGRV
jgi:hypothetical protein